MLVMPEYITKVINIFQNVFQIELKLLLTISCNICLCTSVRILPKTISNNPAISIVNKYKMCVTDILNFQKKIIPHWVT